MRSKKLYLVSLGCPKNLVDSELMLGSMQRAGYEVCEAPEEALVILVNTCGFIQSAVEEAIDETQTPSIRGMRLCPDVGMLDR